jgi:hypothetical protein
MVENDAMKLRRGTKGVLQTYSLVTGKWVSMLKMTRLLHPTGLKAVNVNYTTGN